MPAYFYHLAFELQADNNNNNNQETLKDIGRVLGKSVLPSQDTDLFGQPFQQSTPCLSPSSQPYLGIFTSTPARDWRFDRLSIEGIDMMSNASYNNSCSNSSRDHCLNGSKTIEAGTDAPAAKGKFVPLDSKNTELGWGVVHLFRDGEETPGLYDDVRGSHAKSSSKKGAPKSSELGGGSSWKEEDCTTLCILAVPSYLTPSDLLGFVGEKTTNDVSHFRMIRTERTNRYMVLMKFRGARRAREWRKEWNGKQFNDMEPEYCHVVFIKSIQFHTSGAGMDSSTFPNLKNDPLTPQPPTSTELSSTSGPTTTSSKVTPSTLSTKPIAPPTPSLVELPTCPVCLERMDDTTGLLTILCQHVFHCSCLQKWRGSGCPVCRYTQGHRLGGGYMKEHAMMDGKLEARLCSVCASDANLWMCLICGNIGCGRYDEAHAFAHYQETSHSYAMDVDTQRVWDYAGDGYVHRLIQSESDGKLVELPSALANLYTSNDIEDGIGGADYVPREKLDNIGMEYTYLLTSQLESQRLYFEEKVAQAADKASKASKAAEESAASAQRAQEALARLESTHQCLTQDTLPSLERDKARIEAKNERLTDMARKMEKEWREEKTITESLMEKINHLTQEMEKLKGTNRDLEEQNRDLTFFISGQAKLEGLGDEVRDGTLTVGEAPGKSKKSKGKGKK